jgi:hypothetical protein
MNKLFNNKKGGAIGLIIVIGLLVLAAAWIIMVWTSAPTSTKEVSFLGWSEKITTQNKGAIFLLDVGTFVFGKVPEPLFDLTTSLAGAIIIMSLLGIMLGLIFGDVFKNFSSLTPWVSYSVGAILAVILVNLKVTGYYLLRMTEIFGFLGGIAMFAALFASFFFFFLVEWGIGSAGPWLMKRKAMQFDQKAKVGSTAVISSINMFKAAGRALASP